MKIIEDGSTNFRADPCKLLALRSGTTIARTRPLRSTIANTLVFLRYAWRIAAGRSGAFSLARGLPP